MEPSLLNEVVLVTSSSKQSDATDLALSTATRAVSTASPARRSAQNILPASALIAHGQSFQHTDAVQNVPAMTSRIDVGVRTRCAPVERLEDSWNGAKSR